MNKHNLERRVRTALERGLSELGVSCELHQIEQLLQYLFLLEKWNRSFNLTAVKKVEEMVVRHLLDSLAVAPFITEAECLDIGTGAGLPGIPLAILYPNKQFSLLDSNSKKIRFVRQALIELELSNIKCLNCRVEALEQAEEQLQYPLIISRAFSSLKTIAQLCYPLLQPAGSLLAMKGKVNSDELAELNSLASPPSEVAVERLAVPMLEEERHLVILR